MTHNFRKNRLFSDAEAELLLVDLLLKKKKPTVLARERSCDPKVLRQMLRGESYTDIRPDLQRQLPDEEAEEGAVRNEDESQLAIYRRCLARDRQRRREDERAAKKAKAAQEREKLREARRKLAAARTGSGTP